MKPACLLLLEAKPAASGAAPWRRFRAARSFLSDIGFDVATLWRESGECGAAQARYLVEVDPRAARASADNFEAAIRTMSDRTPYAAVYAMSPDLADAGRDQDGLTLVDLQAGLDEDFDPAAQQTEADQMRKANIVVTATPQQRTFAEALGVEAVEAPLLAHGERKKRPRFHSDRLLAGVWVEAEAAAIDAARELFERIQERGGGAAPNFAIAGPGASSIDPPNLPFPVTRMPADTAEMVFYRGLDIAVAPDIAGGAPRLDVVAALECGAAPLASSSGLNGLRRHWRLPHFRDLHSLADYLFERGAEMRDGGLVTELRARADWTWSSLTGASARQRERLASRIRAMLPSDAR
ncbi:MAG: hypothetical protein AAF401_04795 [Pseudomonadota bacterium]